MSNDKELQLSMNDDDGNYNFVLKGQVVLSIDSSEINSETANTIYDGLISTMGVTLSAVSKLTDGKLAFYNKG